MLDFRIESFLTVCETHNFTKAARQLSITQPAVTQHIQYLEEKYSCKLFHYQGRTLSLTSKGELLQKYMLSMRYNSSKIIEIMKKPTPSAIDLHIGATKTIGEYVIRPLVQSYLQKYPASNISLTVDNTRTLLHLLDNGKLDFALVEGIFDKSNYCSVLFREEAFLGICAPQHPFAEQTISFEQLLSERILLRESGSGTRAILEQILSEHNYSLGSFSCITEISNFSVIKELVAANIGISFLYNAAAHQELTDGKLKSFRLTDTSPHREFNYVFLKENLFSETFHNFWA